jgi:hypothetical protein
MINAPDGSSPRGYNRFFFEYRLKVSSGLIIIFVLHKIFSPFGFSIGCVTRAPDGSSSYDGMLAADYRLKI